MKFCKPRTHTYEGLNGKETEVQYVTFNDVESRHGSEFSQQWKEFIQDKPTFDLNNDICFYYVDYKECTYRTNSYLNP
jgi:hypothetical protein